MPMEKTFDARDAEARISRDWIRGGHFAAGAGARRPETFSVVIPPPNVTGALHMGHAFNNTLQDILVRWHRMRGFDTLWQAGTDHAGIATQMVVEREMEAEGNVTRAEMGREDFVARVWAQKARSGDRIVEQLQRLGASCDWDRLAFTMSGAPGAPEGEAGNFHDAVIRTFVDFHERGLITRGKRLVNWDPKFETAISDLEVESVEVPGHMWHFKYPLAANPETGERETYTYAERDADGTVLFEEKRDWIAIATTRPETMLGDGAVAVHPSDERYAPIVGKLCEIPVGPREARRLIPIIVDEYPDRDFGSGAVKITGAHDFNDHAVAKRNAIPCYRLMDARAAMRADGAPYAEAAARARAIRDGADATEAEIDAINLVPDAYRGLDRFEARAKVVAEITAEGLAVMVPATDPRLGAPRPAPAPAPLAPDAEPDPTRPGPAPGPRAQDAPSPAQSSSTARPSTAIPSSPGSTRGSPAAGGSRVEPGDAALNGGEPPLAPEEGGEMRTDADQLVPLVEPKTIAQPHGDRSGVVIEPMLTDQWFVDTAKIVQPALDAVRNGDIEIVPESDRKVFFHWLENIEPWCISRQLWWGHRVPVWYGPNVGVVNYEDGSSITVINYDQPVPFCATSKKDTLAAALNYYKDVGISLSVMTTKLASGDAAKEAEPKEDEDDDPIVRLWRDPDVLDTWFSSGLWPLGTLGWPDATPELARYYPTSTLVTGSDILFFWVARMIMMQLAILPDTTPTVERIPFRKVYLHGLVRDAKGKKMSKSLGNVVDPLDLIDEYGADALRFTNAAMASLGGALKLDVQRIAGYRNFGTKLWNAVRFAEMYDVWTSDADHPRITRPSPATSTVNRWIIGETARTRAEVDAALAAYRFDDAANALYRFVWNVVCDWYVELSKPVLQGEASDAKSETQATMGWVLEQCMALLHPFMPFVTEELWRVTGHDGMLVTGIWPEDLDDALIDAGAQSEIRWVIAFVEAVRSARAQMNVPAGAQVPVVAVDWDDAARAAYAANADRIAALARVDGLTEAAAPRGSIAVTVMGGRFALPLEGLVDVAAERARLEKAAAKLDREIKGIAGRVDNPRFAGSAPAEVVEEARANLAARQGERAALQTALDSLAEIG